MQNTPEGYQGLSQSEASISPKPVLQGTLVLEVFFHIVFLFSCLLYYFNHHETTIG
jgi:hypothetical protein